MPGHDYHGYHPPPPPGDLMDRIKMRLVEHQQEKRMRRRQLAAVIAVILLFAIPASAYNIAKEYRGFASGVRIAIENEEGIEIGQTLRYKNWSLTIDTAVWEDNDLAVTYSVQGTAFRLGALQVVDENGKEINRGYAVSGHALNEAVGRGTIDFQDLDLTSVQGERVWLRILSLIKNETPPMVAASIPLEISPAMPRGEWVEVKKKLEVEKGTYLLRNIYLGRDDIRLEFDFIPRDKYREFYTSDLGPGFLPMVRLRAGGKSYAYGGGSMSLQDGVVHRTAHFDDFPVEDIRSLQIDVIDSVVLVDWKVPIPIQAKEAEERALTQEIRLPEGKLLLTGMRLGTKSTAIDFTFEPAWGFEGITSIMFDAYLKGNGKYYHYHGFQHDFGRPGLSGTVTFDPVRYDNLEELEFILGKIEYTYTTDAGVTVSPAHVPQTIEALGNTFVIDQMEYREGRTLLHVTFDRENRWFFNASFDIRVPGATSLKVRSETEMGPVEWRDEEDLKAGWQRLRERLKDYPWGLEDINTAHNPVGTRITISGERREVELSLVGLTTVRFSGDTVKIPVR